MDFRGKLILAPLAGVTDTTFRRLCRENGADIVVTEMVSAKGLLCDPARSGRYLVFDEAERPVGAQLFGPDPGEIAEAAAEVARRGFDFVDLNMGCPVRKVTGGGAGAAILSDPRRAGEKASVAELRRAADLDRSSAEASFELGQSLYRLRRSHREAREALEQALSRDPTDARAHYLLGRVCYEQGDRACGDEQMRLSEKQRGR